jgi:hypothetical protein
MRRKYECVTLPELRRVKELHDAGMPCGSIAIICRLDFGAERDGASVRGILQRYFPDYERRPHGNPFPKRTTA